jgi:hypothetical protein
MRFGFGGGAEGFSSPTLVEQYILDVTSRKDLDAGNLMAKDAPRKSIIPALLFNYL